MDGDGNGCVADAEGRVTHETQLSFRDEKTKVDESRQGSVIRDRKKI
jgi:hypothetical protein